nr:transposase family protein [Paenibacillus popilliae]
MPVTYKQPCPVCHSEQDVKRDGSNKPRKIRHLAVFGRKSYLHVPSIRLACSRCKVGFVWSYEFVAATSFVCKPWNRHLALPRHTVRGYKKRLPASEFSCAETQSRRDGSGSGVSKMDQRMFPQCPPHCGSVPCSLKRAKTS